MIKQELPVLGFTVLVNVPATTDEYNTLAPKRTNPVLEDAVASTCYRSVSPVIRDGLCAFLDADPAPAENPTEAQVKAAGLGIKRKNFGTEEEPQLEKEGVFIKRAIQTLMQTRNENEQQVRAFLQPTVQAIADSDDAKFNPALREGTGTGPAIGKNDLKLAAQVIADGKADLVAAKLSEKLGVTITTDEKSLARAIADDRRARAAIAAAEQKSALGI